MNDAKLEKVRAWLEKSGYPLELEIARQVEAIELAWTQSWHYLDEDTQKYRETDVIAWKEILLRTDRDPVLVRLSLCIECKRSDASWVAFTSKRTSPGDLFEVFATPASEYGTKVLKRIAPFLLESPAFQRDDPVAYSVTTAHLGKKGQPRNERDSAYGAIRGVSDGSIARARAADGAGMTVAEIVVPLIVFDGDLLAATLQDSGEISLDPVDEILVVQRRPTEQRPFTIVRIVTAARVTNYLERFLKSTTVLDIHKDAIRLAIENHRKNSGPVVVL